MSSSIITVATLKEHLGITGTAEDDALEGVVCGVNAAVEAHCRRVFATGTRTEYLDGTGTDRLYLPSPPLTAVTSVAVANTPYGDAGDAAGTAWTRNVEYVVPRVSEDERNRGLLMAVNRSWPEGVANVRVVYASGYTAMPGDLKLAAHQVAASVRGSLKSGEMVESESLGDYAYKLAMPGGPPRLGDARRTLNHYTVPVW